MNGIENFWKIAKMKLYKFKGMNKEFFYLHLKETEFRFNHRPNPFESEQENLKETEFKFNHRHKNLDLLLYKNI